MPLSLSHLAEDIFAQMINESRDAFIQVAGLESEADPEFIKAAPELASCEVCFEPVHGRAFDGARRVDVVVRLRPGVATAFELKLGMTRLTKTRLDDEWLQPCVPSHGGRRWKGNVIAVLDRRFPDVAVTELVARMATERLKLTRPWFFVARRQVLQAWKNDPPSFSSAARQLAFEDVVDGFGGKTAFNPLVRKMLNIDYFEEWVGNAR